MHTIKRLDEQGLVQIGEFGRGWIPPGMIGVRLLKCPDCEKKNYGPAQSSGRCAWCGWSVSDAIIKGVTP